MRADIKRELLGEYFIEFAICFIVSMSLLYYQLSMPESDMMKAVVTNDLGRVKQLISSSEALDERGPCSESLSISTTPLIEAARLGRKEIVLELLNAGANINSRDDYGTSALVAALSRGHVETSLALAENHADPNLATCIGHGSCTTALRCARRLKDSQLTQKMESLGGTEYPDHLFPLECLWIEFEPMLLFALTRIAPIVFVVMFSGHFIRRYFHR
jgi:Ankyrin repeats (3 copies)